MLVEENVSAMAELLLVRLVAPVLGVVACTKFSNVMERLVELARVLLPPEYNVTLERYCLSQNCSNSLAQGRVLIS